MTQIMLNGSVSNLTGGALVILTSPDSQPIRQFKKDGLAVVDTQEEFLGFLNNKVELSYSRVTGVRGLPSAKDGQYYIVSKKVARAAMLMGRTLQDLLVPDLPIFYNEGNARGIQGYRRLIPAIYYCQSV